MFVFNVAGPEDDADIRALLRDSPLPGSISLTVEREPDTRIAARAEGEPHETIVARYRRTGTIAGVAARSVRDRFVNGSPARVAYLGQLRVSHRCLSKALLIQRGFSFCRKLQQRNPCAVHLASVATDNSVARRILERGQSEWPPFTPVDDVLTLVMRAGSTRATRSDTLEICSGTEVGASALATFLWRTSARYQFAPCWNAEDLTALPGLELHDFMVATRNGAIAGCAALWNQRPFKQVVVRGYAPALRRSRLLLNLMAPLTGLPHLPRPGQELRFAFVSHFAIEHDDTDTAMLLVGEAAKRARTAGLDHIALGLSRRSQVANAVSMRFRHRSYSTTLYAAAWGGTTDIHAWPSQPEIAIL
jgi:hypothetical protein